MENLYEILEVSEKASKEIIDKAYRVLAKKYHPDLQNEYDRSKAEEMMKKINMAYDVLGNEDKKKEYDISLEKLRKEEEDESTNEYIKNSYYQYEYKSKNVEEQSNACNRNSKQNEEPYIDKDWKIQYNKLSYKDKRKVMKKIQKNANEEYRKMYEEYYSSLGYVVPHKWTIKDIITLIIALLILILTFFILWIIPITREWMINLYNTNSIIKILVNIIIAMFEAIVKTIRVMFEGNILA